MVDFIEEVEEKLRSDRYAVLARRLLPWFAAALTATVIGWLGIWGYHTWQDRNVAKASEAYDRGISALAQGDAAGAYTAFEPIGKSGPPAYRTLALMQQGNIRLMAGKPAEAVGFYDAAARAGPNPIFSDLARLRAVLALIDTAPYPQIATRLAPLIGDKRPYDLQAREALAMAKLLAGKTAAARGDFNALSLSLGATPAMRARAQVAIALIDAGGTGAAAEVLRAAATLPPPNPATVGSLQDAPAAGGPSAPQDGAPVTSGSRAP